MLKKLKDFIIGFDLINPKDKLVLAVSGGKDSVAMAHLFSSLEYDFVIAHCNFMMRGEESDEDASFVKELSEKLNIPFFYKKFNTKKYSKENKVSIQMAARDLRYSWFDQLLKENKFNKIVTAHHKDDSIETLLLKKARKSSLEGLRGILPINGDKIRPMLCFNFDEIIEYLSKNSFEYREDSSNMSSDYQRNYIRNVILPKLEKDESQIREILLDEIKTNQENFVVLKDLSYLIKKRYFYSIPNGFRLEIPWVDVFHEYQEILYELLKNFGPFNWKDVFNLLSSENGRFVNNHEFRIIKERKCLEISNNKKLTSKTFLVNVNETELLNLSLNLKFEKLHVDDCTFEDSVLFLDYSKLTFPLKIRKWKKGDKFQGPCLIEAEGEIVRLRCC